MPEKEVDVGGTFQVEKATQRKTQEAGCLGNKSISEMQAGN